MIFIAPAGNAAGAATVASDVSEYAIATRVYNSSGWGAAPPEISLEGDPGESAEIRPVVEIDEQPDWSDRSQVRRYVRLEQKVLAKQANAEERSRYQFLKRDRNANIFAERYMRDYAEIKRLKELSKKLAEIQQFVVPIDA